LALASPRIGVLGDPDGYYVQDLCRAASGLCSIEVISFGTLGAGLYGHQLKAWDHSRQELQAYDALVVRTMPWGTLEQIIFRMDALHGLESAGVRVVNSASCLEIAIDKFRSLQLLQKAGLPVPQTVACQNVTQAMDVFQKWGGIAVVKPMFGGEGRGIMRVEDEELAARTFKTLVQLGAVIYLQEFIPHQGYDIRVMVMQGRTWAIRRSHPSDWRTNISRGAIAEPVTLEPEWRELASRTAAALGAHVAGVDLLIDRDGRPWILEINAVPGWKGLGQALGVDFAREFLTTVVGAA
jgi:RimK family alpha-L-glutamate ligase